MIKIIILEIIVNYSIEKFNLLKNMNCFDILYYFKHCFTS